MTHSNRSPGAMKVSPTLFHGFSHPNLPVGFKEGWPIAETSVGSHVIPILSYSKSGWWFHPLWKIWRIVSWDDDIPNIWKIKHVPNHQAANCLLVTFLDLLVWGPKVQHILNRFPSHGGLTNRKRQIINWAHQPIQVNPNVHPMFTV